MNPTNYINTLHSASFSSLPTHTHTHTHTHGGKIFRVQRRQDESGGQI